jgi:hypothetical protein
MAKLIAKLGKALGVLVAIYSTAGVSYSAEIPREFIGIWAIATATENQCKKSDWDNSRSDGMISIAGRSIDYWETRCTIASIKELYNSTVGVSLVCGGEGTTWRSDEVWHVQKVGVRKQLISISLRRSDVQKEKQRIGVSIYLQCKQAN